MGLHEVLQRNQWLVAVLAVAVIVGSAVYLARGRTKSPMRPDQIYFYDVGTGQLFPGDRTVRPPIDAPSGPGRGVRSYVFACGECRPDTLQVVYVMTYTEKAVAAIAQLNRETSAGGGVNQTLSQVVDDGTLVALPPAAGGDLRWTPAQSDEGLDIVRRSSTLCGGRDATPCFPN